MDTLSSSSPPSGVPATAAAANVAGDPGGAPPDAALPAPRERGGDTIRDVLARRKVRVGGWTPIKVAAFIEHLAATGSVTEAAAYVRMSTVAAYALRNHPDGAPFAEAWDDAVGARYEMLADIALDRVKNGTERLRWYKGERVGQEQVFSERLLMFMLDKCDPARRTVAGVRQAGRGGAGRCAACAGSCAGTCAGSIGAAGGPGVFDTPQPAPLRLADGSFAPDPDPADELAAALAAEFEREDWLPPEVLAGMAEQAAGFAAEKAAQAAFDARMDAGLAAGRAAKNRGRGR